MLIDTHCHLDFPQFEEDRSEVIARAREVGVQKMVTIGCRASTFEQTLKISESDKNIFAAVGVHPCDITEKFSEESVLLEEYVQKEKVVAIGETGLDFFREENPSQTDQIFALEKHIDLSEKYNKPLIIHLRDAEKQALEFFSASHDFPFVLHCFIGDWNYAKKMLDLGAMLSFSGVVTFKNCEEDLLEVVKKVPADRFFVETDAPFLAPTPNRGKRNEPAFVADVAKVVAELRGESVEEVEENTTRNAEKFFGI